MTHTSQSLQQLLDIIYHTVKAELPALVEKLKVEGLITEQADKNRTHFMRRMGLALLMTL